MFDIKLTSGLWIRVEGYPVTIRGFEKYQFFVHHSVTTSTPISEDHWNVSELLSGCAVTEKAYRTDLEAIQGATETLHASKAWQVMLRLDKAIAQSSGDHWYWQP